jgi:hypothetical protein
MKEVFAPFCVTTLGSTLLFYLTNFTVKVQSSLSPSDSTFNTVWRAWASLSWFAVLVSRVLTAERQTAYSSRQVFLRIFTHMSPNVPKRFNFHILPPSLLCTAGGYLGCGHGHKGHPGRPHWSCCGKFAEKSECTYSSGPSAGRSLLRTVAL